VSAVAVIGVEIVGVIVVGILDWVATLILIGVAIVVAFAFALEERPMT